MGEKVTRKVELDLELDRLQRAAKTASDAVAGIGGDFSKGFEKKLQAVLLQIEKLRKKASQPIDSAGGFSSLERGLSAITAEAKTLFSEITRLQGLTTKEKISLLPEEEATKIRDAIAAIQEYEKAVERAEKKRIRTLENSQATLATKEKELADKETEAKNKRKKVTDATSSSTEYGQAKAILEQAEAAKKARKEIAELERTLKSYQKELKELEEIEDKTPEQMERMTRLRSDIQSVGGKIGSRRRIVNSGPKETEITQAQGVVDAKQSTIDQLEKEATAAEKEVTKLNNTISDLKKKIENNSTTIKASASDFKILREQASKLGISLDGIGEDASAENVALLKTRIQDFVDNGLQPLETALEEVGPEMQSLGHDASEAGEKVRQVGEDFSQAAEDAKKLENLKQTFARFVGWTGATRALSAALRNAFADIKELDAAMTEIAVVTKFDIGDMWDQMPTYTNRANELGMSITEVYRASALFYQQGLDTNEMMALSNETLKMARIAGLDAAEASDRMTAALRGFNMELDQASAQKIADVYSKLAAITASDVDEISTAMTKTASIASSAGMEFETTAAFLSQIIETTRESAETAGTAMKTVIARFQELKKSPSEIGEIDGEIVDANAIEGALRSVGVSLRDASGQFRELDDVFLELSSKWNSLDTNTQRYIATIAAGSRQQSRFIAMMQDYGRTQELVAAANNSAGASQEQYDKTLDSLETKLTKLDNAWTEFSTGLMNSDFVKFAVDFLTSVLNGLTKVTEGFDSFTGSLSKVGTLIAIFQTAKVIISNFFDEVISKVYTSATRVGDSIARGVQDGMAQNGPGAAVGNALGLTAMSQGVGQMKEAKSLRANGKVNDEAAVKWKKEHNQLLSVQEAREKRLISLKEKEAELIAEGADESEELLKIQEDLNGANEEYAAGQEEIEKSLQDRMYTEEEVNEKSKAGFAQACDGAKQMASALTMVGAGFGMIGQALTESGLVGAGEVFAEVGKWVTLLGSALMILIPIIKFTGTVFTIESGEIAVAGTTAQLAWWWVFIILIAIVALAAGIAAGFKAVENASPEKKLEKMQDSADEAAAAAEKMQQAYEDLKNSLSDIGEANDELKNLAYGTDSWREAVEKLNDQVIDLIQKYPQLAQFVKNKDGVLTIDTESAEVQAVLEEAKRTANKAQINATQAQLNVIEARNQVNYEGLSNDAKLNYRDPEKAASGAYAHAMAGSVATGTVAGGVIGSAIGGWAFGLGTAIGAVVGGIAGAIGGIFAGNANAEAKAEKARKQNEAGMKKTEDLAQALANGDLIDTGSGYRLREGLDETTFDMKYAQLAKENLEDLYKEVGSSTKELIAFGQSLNETRKVTNAYYDSMAAQIWSNTDTTNMSDEAKAIGSNIVDGNRYAIKSDAVLNELAEVDMLADNEGSDAIGDELATRRAEAIQAAYGDGAKLQEGENGQEIVDANGEVIRSNVTSDDVKNIVASSETAAEMEKVASLMPQVVNDLLDPETGLGKDINADTSKVQDAIIAALSNESGENLTSEQLEIIKEIAKDEGDALEGLYNSSTSIQQAFGTLENFVETFGNAADNASKAFDQSSEFFSGKNLNVSSLSSGALLGLSNEKRLGSLYAKANEQEIASFAEAFNSVMDSEYSEKIAQYLNSIDWSNQEALIGMQYELQELYGVSEEEARALRESMIEANDAVSTVAASARVFDELHQAIEKLNKSSQKLADQQWDHERLVRGNASALEIANSLEERRNMLMQHATDALTNFEMAKDKEAEIFAEGVTRVAGIDLTRYVTYDSETDSYDISALSERMLTMSAEQKEATKTWLEQVNEANSTAREQLDVAKDSYEELEEMNDEGKEAYENLFEQFSDLILAQLEKEIEIQKEIRDATETANGEIIDKIQQQIDADRQAREEEKAKQNLTDLAKRISYLRMDSSGSNAIEIASLEKQLKEETEAFEDAQIDKSLAAMQDSNEEAAKQRERQIAIAEAQLEAYKNSEAFEQQVQTKLDSYFASFETYKQNMATWEEAYDLWATADKLDMQTQQNLLTAVRDNDIDYIKTVFPNASAAAITKYGEIVTATGGVSEAAATAAGTVSNAIETKPTFDDDADKIAKEFIEAGIINGTNSEQNEFLTELGKDTGLASDYLEGVKGSTADTDKNTEPAEGQTMASLLSAIAGTASEKFGNQGLTTGYTTANAQRSAMSKMLGFTLSNTSVKGQDDSVDYGHSSTQDFVSDVSAISSTLPLQQQELTEKRTQAQSQFETMKKYNYADDTASETSYYGNLLGTNADGTTKQSELDFRDSLLSEGYIDNDQMWHSQIATQYANMQNSWRTSGFTKEIAAIAETGHRDGFEGIVENYKTNGLLALKQKHMDILGLSETDARDDIKEALVAYMKHFTYGSIDGDGDDGWKSYPGKWGKKADGGTTTTKANGKYKLDGKVYKDIEFRLAGNSSISQLENNFLPSPEKGWMAMSGGHIYSYDSDNKVWLQLKESTQGSRDLANAYRKKVRQGRDGYPFPAFKTGGLADFTGPAWLDGTKSRPEYILDAEQTSSFFALVDVLESLKTNEGARGGGDNYFDISINVEKLEDDYDLEQVADKIRRMIYDDASYRNVNTINLTH